MAVASLPLDVLDVLCQFVGQRDLVSLSTASSSFYPFAQRYLYRRIALPGPNHVVRFMKTLQRRPELARHVRSLSLRMDTASPVLLSFVDLLASGIALMVNIVSLDVVLPHTARRAFFAAEIHGTVYTRLTRFSCNLPLDDAICSFLQRVPAMKELQLGECTGTLSGSTSSPSIPVLPPSALPNLTFFMGSSDAATALVPGRPLESVHLYSGELSEQVLLALSRASSPITVFSAFTHSLSPSTVQCLAESLPHLHFLRIMTMYSASNHPDEAFYGQAVQILSTLPELVSAELAGFRWFSWKDTASVGSGSSAQAKSNPTTAHVTPAAAQDEPYSADSVDIGLF